MLDANSSQTLLGVLIDVSSSMRRNWKNRDGKKMPQIAVVRDALNKELSRIKFLYPENNYPNLHLFCLGIGFQHPINLVSVDLSRNREKIISETSREHIVADLICDLLALSEIIPTHAELSILEQEINDRWQKYAIRCLSGINLDDSANAQLICWIQKQFYQGGLLYLHLSPAYTVFKILKSWPLGQKSKWLKKLFSRTNLFVSFSQNIIDEVADQVGEKYLSRIIKDAQHVFFTNQESYQLIIKEFIQDFVNKQTQKLVNLLTLGFEPMTLLETFDEEQVNILSENVYQYLRDDVEKKIQGAWIQSLKWLQGQANKIHVRVPYVELRELSETSIRKTIWDLLRPFVEKTVVGIFEDTFEKEAEKQLSHWINLASQREIRRPVENVVNLLPDALEQDIYSTKFMFGTTPIVEAFDVASLRMMDPEVKNYRKILLLISDGEFKTNIPLEEAALLKKAGVIIVCCYIFNHDLPEGIKVNIKRNWPKGAQVMYEISSPIVQNDWFYQSFVDREINVEFKNRWFRQINRSSILEEIFEHLLRINFPSSDKISLVE